MGSQKPLRVEFVTYTRRKGFYVARAGGSTPDLIVNLANLPPASILTPLNLQIFWGPDADTTEHQIELYCVMVDVDNLPTMGSIREAAIWTGSQKWMTVGTPATVLQAMSQSEREFTRPQSYASVTVNDRLRTSAMAIIAQISSSLLIKVHGVFTWEVTLRQRVWRDDNAYEGLLMEESPLWDD